MSETQAPGFDFMALSPEIRNMIYRSLYENKGEISDEECQISCWNHGPYRRDMHYPLFDLRKKVSLEDIWDRGFSIDGVARCPPCREFRLPKLLRHDSEIFQTPTFDQADDRSWPLVFVGRSNRHDHQRVRLPALCFASKAIYYESMAVFGERVRIICHSPSLLWTTIRDIHLAGTQNMIRNLTLCIEETMFVMLEEVYEDWGPGYLENFGDWEPVIAAAKPRFLKVAFPALQRLTLIFPRNITKHLALSYPFRCKAGLKRLFKFIRLYLQPKLAGSGIRKVTIMDADGVVDVAELQAANLVEGASVFSGLQDAIMRDDAPTGDDVQKKDQEQSEEKDTRRDSVSRAYSS